VPHLKGSVKPAVTYETHLAPSQFVKKPYEGQHVREMLDKEAEDTACLAHALAQYMTAHGLDTLNRVEIKDDKVVLYA
jgi:hypothetical protein